MAYLVWREQYSAHSLGGGRVRRHLVGVVGAVGPRVVDQLVIPLRRGAVVVEAEALGEQAAHMRRIDARLTQGDVHLPKANA